MPINLTESSFCSQLSPAALKDLQSLAMGVIYPEDSILFQEEDAVRGVFVLLRGLVKLTVSSTEGKTLILRLARPGTILGLSATISGNPYEASAIAVHTSEIGFVRREDFAAFIARHLEVYELIARESIVQQSEALEQLRLVGLSASVPERLARLLLNWSSTGQETRQGVSVKLPLTHEEIGEFIGTSRETISRTLSEFKSRRMVELHGSTLTISNRHALEQMSVA
ncbi:MAG: Crp/Fnr family transcriptional regulator [Acidobacteriia bacterium]|nr:Crp/Fnr family transcriptional regulator [Terriglobia bacterium]